MRNFPFGLVVLFLSTFFFVQAQGETDEGSRFVDDLFIYSGLVKFECSDFGIDISENGQDVPDMSIVACGYADIGSPTRAVIDSFIAESSDAVMYQTPWEVSDTNSSLLRLTKTVGLNTRGGTSSLIMYYAVGDGKDLLVDIFWAVEYYPL